MTTPPEAPLSRAEIEAARQAALNAAFSQYLLDLKTMSRADARYKWEKTRQAAFAVYQTAIGLLARAKLE